MTNPCGNPKCSCSTGIHEGLTFGSGRLTPNGYWEFPCPICARDCDKRMPDSRQKVLQEYIARGMSEQEAQKEIRINHEWLFMQAWPFPGQDIAQLTKEMQPELDEWDKEADEIDAILDEMCPEDPTCYDDDAPLTEQEKDAIIVSLMRMPRDG